MKKVLFIATVIKTHINVFHIPYLKWFKENGYEVHVCAKNDYDNKNDCNIKYCDKFYDLPFNRNPLSRDNIRTLSGLKKIIDETNYDIIHCHTPIGGMLARLSAIKARKKGTKVIYTVHGFHFYEGAPLKNRLIYYTAEKILSRYTDAIITINMEDYNRALKFHCKNIHYVPGVGVDLDKIAKNRINKNKKREELSIPQNAFVILSIGELIKNKNHQLVIKAISKLNIDNIFYVICGSGSLETHLKDLAESLNLDANVKFLGFREDASDICMASDMFAFPSLREGLPLSVMEAMAVGLPLVVTNCRGNRDLVADDINGYVVDVCDTACFADRIQKIYENAEIRERFKEENLKRIDKYSLESVMKIMEIIYKQYI